MEKVTIVKDEPVDQAMEAAKAELVEQQEPAPEAPAPVSERPGWLPEKFNSAEDLAKAYSELEKKFSKPEGKPAPEDATEAPSGLDLSPYAEEYANNGELSEESIQKLVASGIPENVLSTYIDGVRALEEAQTNSVYNMVGGQQSYETMLEWASENMTEGEIDAFNSIVENGDMNSISMAVRGLEARYVQINGRPSKLVQGEVSGPSTSAFRSVAEVTAAMRDPRYTKDPAYRREVEERLRNANILGVTSR